MARRLNNRDRNLEWRRQSRIFNGLAKQFRPMFDSTLQSAMREMVYTWEYVGFVQTPSTLYGKIEGIYKALAQAAVTQMGRRILDQGKAAGVVLEVKEDLATMFMRWALEYIFSELMRTRITNVTETTREEIVKAVARGYADGLGQREVAQRILEEIPEMSDYRANLIARTETHGAANYGAQRAAQYSGLPLRREWISGLDRRTRAIFRDDQFDHVEADRQTVGMDEPFLIRKRTGGVEALMYPGDPAGSAGNVINCRCSVGFIVDESRLFD